MYLLKTNLKYIETILYQTWGEISEAQFGGYEKPPAQEG